MSSDLEALERRVRQRLLAAMEPFHGMPSGPHVLAGVKRRVHEVLLSELASVVPPYSPDDVVVTQQHDWIEIKFRHDAYSVLPTRCSIATEKRSARGSKSHLLGMAAHMGCQNPHIIEEWPGGAVVGYDEGPPEDEVREFLETERPLGSLWLIRQRNDLK